MWCVSGCGKSVQASVNIQPYIIHGSDAVAGRWPWQVAIIVDASFICGGSLVDEFHVVTAAHCMM